MTDEPVPADPVPAPVPGTSPPAAGPGHPRRWWALGALVLSVLVLGFDTTILNIALPTLAAELHLTTGQQQWVIDAFLLTFAAGMLPAGLLGDRFGRRALLITGLALMLAGSLLGAAAGGPGLLIAARAVMGLGGALIAPLAVAVLPALFGPAERAKAVAAVTGALAAGMPLGPLLGGWLLDHYAWNSVFLVNVPLVALGIAACLWLLPETRDPAAPRVRPLPTLLSFAGLGALIHGVVEGPARGWTDPLVLASLIAAPLLLAALVRTERGRPRPVLDLAMLRDRTFGPFALTGTLVTFVLTGVLFVVPQYLQAVRGHDALATGIRLMPLMAGLIVAARAAAPLARRFGARAVVATGLAVLAFAAFLGAGTRADTGYALTASWLGVAGLAVGLVLVPAMDSALGAIGPERSGTGSGLLMTVRQVGGALGVAVLGSVLAQSYAGALPPNAPAGAGESVTAAHALAETGGLPALAAAADTAFTEAMSMVLFVSGCAALLCALLAARLLPDTRQWAA